MGLGSILGNALKLSPLKLGLGIGAAALIAPAALKLLGHVAGDLFSAGKFVAKGALGLAIGSPLLALGGLAGGGLLAGGLGGALAQSVGMGGVGSALFGTSQFQVPGSAGTLQGQGGLLNVGGILGRGTGINTFASTAIGNVLGGTASGSGGVESANMAAAFNSGPTYDQMKKDFESKGLKPEDASMMALQEEQQRYNRMLTLMTNLLQMKHEGLKSVIQNMRA